MSIYNYVTLPPFYPQILNFSALKSKLFEVSKTKELPEAKLSVASVPVGNYRIQLNVHSRKVPIHKLSQIGKNHSDDGSYQFVWEISSRTANVTSFSCINIVTQIIFYNQLTRIRFDENKNETLQRDIYLFIQLIIY